MSSHKNKNLGFSYLFLDECLNEKLDIASLTGIVVPLEKYLDVRDMMNSLIWEIMKPPENVCPMPLELHGSALLLSDPEKYKDSDKIHAFKSCVEIVNALKLKVIRSTHGNCKQLRKLFKYDKNIYGHNWFRLKDKLSEILCDQIVQPVVDGVPLNYKKLDGKEGIEVQLVRSFSISKHHMDFWHGHTCLEYSIAGFRNIAQPVFADSSTSVHLQLTDMISYLLLQVESRALNSRSEMSDFKRSMLEVARMIDPSLLVSELRN